MKRLWSIALLAALLTTGAAGCSRASETLSQLKQDFKQDVAWNVSQEDASQQANQLEVPDANDISIEETYEPVQTIGDAVQEITVSLYFADADQQKLVKTEKQIPKVEGMGPRHHRNAAGGASAGQRFGGGGAQRHPAIGYQRKARREKMYCGL